MIVNEWAAGSVNVIANDTDPEGNYPLTLVSVSSPTGAAYVASSTHVGWSGYDAGLYPVTYVVRDSLGATSTGTLTVRVRLPVNPCGTRICQ